MPPAPTQFFTHDDIKNLIKNEKKIIVTYQCGVYDVTDFADRHPGGSDLIEDYNGEDISLIFYDEDSHIHSKNGLSILENKCIGKLAAQTKKTKQPENLKIYPLMDENYIGHYKNFSIDFNKPLVPQVYHLNRDEYLHFIHTPVFLPFTARLFRIMLFEFFSWNRWWFIPVAYIPIIMAFLYLGMFTNFSSTEYFLDKYYRFDFPEFSYCLLIFTMLIGVGVWTATEYVIHRWLFHMDEYLPDFHFLRVAHFIIHGIHHLIPMDPLRLVFPPAVSIIIFYFISKFFATIFVGNCGAIIIASASIGYTCYDIIHYLLHHETPKFEYMKEMKNYHNKHHYKNPHTGYGVSVKIWDYVGKTVA